MTQPSTSEYNRFVKCFRTTTLFILLRQLSLSFFQNKLYSLIETKRGCTKNKGLVDLSSSRMTEVTPLCLYASRHIHAYIHRQQPIFCLHKKITPDCKVYTFITKRNKYLPIGATGGFEK